MVVVRVRCRIAVRDCTMVGEGMECERTVRRAGRRPGTRTGTGVGLGGSDRTRGNETCRDSCRSRNHLQEARSKIHVPSTHRDRL